MKRNLQYPCTECPPAGGVDRLLWIMARWWEGWSLRRQAAVLEISPTRVRYLLLRAGCEEWLRSPARRARWKPKARGASRQRQMQARAALVGWRSDRLPVNQRGALAWTAMGRSAGETAWRLGITVAKVRKLIAYQGAPARLRGLPQGFRLKRGWWNAELEAVRAGGVAGPSPITRPTETDDETDED
jgi:hypothetical protein